MRKEEFLQTLRRALTGDVPPGVVEENIRYYDSYIGEEVRKGRTEEEVIREIGDPRLIARTIEDTTDGAGKADISPRKAMSMAAGKAAAGMDPVLMGGGLSWIAVLPRTDRFVCFGWTSGMGNC